MDNFGKKIFRFPCDDAVWGFVKVGDFIGEDERLRDIVELTVRKDREV